MSLNSIIYRLAKITELSIVLELVKEFHILEKLSFDEQTDVNALKKILTDESLGQIWIIEQENNVVGYIIVVLGFSIEYGGRDAFIDEFYIREQYQGQGIGTMTLAFVEKSCQSIGVRALHLEVDFENFAAQRLYKKVGYEPHNRYLMTKNFTL